MYYFIKIVHVISAAVLFGAVLGAAFYLFCANRQKDIALMAQATQQVVFVNWVLTLPFGIVQWITGMLLMFLKGYAFDAFWVVGSMMGAVIAGACWVLIAWLQMRCRDLAFDAVHHRRALSTTYHRYYRIWWMLGVPAFAALMVVFYLMINKPT